MKKKTTVIVALLLVLALILCSRGKNLNSEGYWKDFTASEYVTLPDLDSIEIKKADLEEQIDHLRSQYPITKEVTDREVKDGDTVNIDYVGSVNGIEFDGGSTNGEGTDVTIGVTSYIDDFLEQLIGHEPGETFNVEVTFPDPYEQNTALSGADAVFTTTINYIKEEELPEWNDNFIETNYYGTQGWKNTEEAEESIIHFLVEEYMHENSTIEKDIPQVLIDCQKESAIAYYQNYADAYNMSLDDFLTYYMGVDGSEDLLEQLKDSITEYSEYYLIYQAIAEKLNYKVTEDEIKEYFLLQQGTEDYKDSADKFGLPYLKFMVMSQNVITKIAENAKVVE